MYSYYRLYNNRHATMCVIKLFEGNLLKYVGVHVYANSWRVVLQQESIVLV